MASNAGSYERNEGGDEAEGYIGLKRHEMFVITRLVLTSWCAGTVKLMSSFKLILLVLHCVSSSPKPVVIERLF